VSARAGALTALAAGLAILIALGLVLSQSKPRLAGTNNVRDPIFAAVVPGGAAVCQSGQGIPGDSDRVRVLVGTYGTPLPPLTITADGPGKHVTGRIRGGGKEGYVFIPVPRNDRPVENLTICLRNGGATKIAVAGEGIPPPATVGARAAQGRIRYAWYRPGSENWFQLAGTVLHRFGYGNAPWYGGWVLGLVGLLLLAAGGLAIRTVLREPEA
jgi:hypothetical protein